ncbi:MAG: EfeM/EfeO family lipoprotein [Kutzneria sp.]|nr:EfeM/EfeO family lipoprotein [Kutzneria sp.]
MQRLPGSVLAAAAVFATISLVAVFLVGPARRPATESPEIEVTTNGCGTDWAGLSAGTHTFQLHNVGSRPQQVQLVDVPGGRVYGEVETLGPGAEATMDVRMAAGSYALRCVPDDAPTVTGPPATVAGAGTGGPASVAMTRDDLLGPARDYQVYVARRIDELVTETDTVVAAIDTGNLDAARKAWLPAHLTYHRIGAAYRAFGALASDIDGKPDGLAAGTHDPQFAGFRRLEYGLWHAEPAATLRTVADRLATAVRSLRRAAPGIQIDPGDLGVRAHEILEDTLRFELTGDHDFGSGTTLATALADVEGTGEVLSVLEPVLRPRYPGLDDTMAWLDRVRTLLATHQTTPLAGLDRAARQRIDGSIGELLERLAPVAAICAPRGVS